MTMPNNAQLIDPTLTGSPATDLRPNALNHWLTERIAAGALPHIAPHTPYELEALAGDASFRRYARLTVLGQHWMVMDAPPERENSQPYIAIAALFNEFGVRVPQIFAYDLTQGFMILEDFGNVLLSQLLTPQTVDSFYSQAMNQLMGIQKIPVPINFPAYDTQRLMTEMRLFTDWFVPALGLTLDPAEQELLEDTYTLLAQTAQAQPQVMVHRDYHSRNLMVLRAENQLGIIDFQDAVVGPMSYDLVSLLRDAYVHWPHEQVAHWVKIFWQRAQIQGMMPGVPEHQFMQWFDLMGAQRHLKILGIFVRLSQRDGKHGYLNDLPLVLHYLQHEIKPYAVLGTFSQWLEQRVVPAFNAKFPKTQPGKPV